MGNAQQDLLPPRPHTEGGDMRRLGVELEFAGLGIEKASGIVQAELGGEIQVISDYEHRVRGTDLGDFNVELDFEYLKAQGRADGGGEPDALLDSIPEELLARVARHLVPIEVVSPPIPMNRIARLDAVVEGLRDGGALGTRRSAMYAFGLHLNPEMAALDATTIVSNLRAFLCLYDWLLRESKVDWSRRVTPYINAFPTDYVRTVVSPDYAPSLGGLVDDYLARNADRNRALDMLPLFAHLDEERVRAVIDDPRIKARPTLHYRLPNCDVDQPGWGIHVAWRHWLQVERLACDAARLEEMAAAYHAYLHDLPARALSDWAAASEQWLDGGGC